MSNPIDRQAAIDTVHKTIYGFFDIADDESEAPISDKDKLLLEINKAICNGLKELPVIERQPTTDVRENVRGEWIEHKRAEEVEGYLISNYECSCCHTWERINSDYCPNCGAEMRR